MSIPNLCLENRYSVTKQEGSREDSRQVHRLLFPLPGRREMRRCDKHTEGALPMNSGSAAMMEERALPDSHLGSLPGPLQNESCCPTRPRGPAH